MTSLVRRALCGLFRAVEAAGVGLQAAGGQIHVPSVYPGEDKSLPMTEGVLINQAAVRCLAGPQGGPFWGFRAGDRLAVSSPVAR